MYLCACMCSVCVCVGEPMDVVCMHTCMYCVCMFVCIYVRTFMCIILLFIAVVYKMKKYS